MSDDQILGQSLWNNKYICAKSKTRYDESLSKRGITKIYDLHIFNRDQVFKNWDSVRQHFNLRATHFWNGIVF